MSEAFLTIHVDRNRCSGHARCVTVASEVYQVDEEGFCTSDGMTVGPELERPARLGARACPERAITLTEGAGA